MVLDRTHAGFNTCSKRDLNNNLENLPPKTQKQTRVHARKFGSDNLVPQAGANIDQALGPALTTSLPSVFSYYSG
jgi:hypothetical protein